MVPRLQKSLALFSTCRVLSVAGGSGDASPRPLYSWSEHTLPITGLWIGAGGATAILLSSSLDHTIKVSLASSLFSQSCFEDASLLSTLEAFSALYQAHPAHHRAGVRGQQGNDCPRFGNAMLSLFLSGTSVRRSARVSLKLRSRSHA